VKGEQAFVRPVVSLLVGIFLACISGAYAFGKHGAANTVTQGPAGPQGPIGMQGLQGLAGADGKDGADGRTGLRGLQGPQGPVGPAGPVGPQGPAGTGGSDPNFVTYFESGSPGPDVTLGTFGPFTLLGRCENVGTDRYESTTVLYATEDNALVTNSTGRGHVFSGSSTEEELAATANYTIFYPVPPWDHSMSESTSFWALSADNTVTIAGEQATAIKNGLTTPTCAWTGSVRTVVH